MGFLGKMKDLLNGESHDMDEDYEGEFEDEYEEELDYYDDEDEAEDYREERAKVVDRDNKVVSIHTTAQLQVVIVRPVKFEEVASIADHLIEKRTVVLNMEQTERSVSRRVVDFLSGAAYAHNGKLKRIANNTYIITPFNVGLVGADVLGELENNGVFF